VKSRKGQRICFSDAAAPQFSMLLTLPERAFEGILFSAVCSALRFYTAKTQSGHEHLKAGRRLFARFETTNAGCGQAKLPKPSNRIAQADKTFPVRLWDFALHVALADFAQGIKFFGT
jgi:hypothetical protein